MDLPVSPVVLLAGLLTLGAVVGAVALGLRARTGLSSRARVVASDTEQGRVQRLHDAELGLVGQPDYILEERVGLLRRKRLVPVELKPHRTSPRLYGSDRMQMAVYLLLMEAEFGSAFAGFGRVRYKADTFRVELTDDLRRACLEAAEGVRRARSGPRPDRSHEISARCRGCSVRNACDQSLA